MAIKSKHLHEIPEDVARRVGIRAYPGYAGEFTRRQAPGAIANGTAIVKVAVDPGGDLHPIGTRGIVLGSIGHPILGIYIYYFVEWDPSPGLASGCFAAKIRKAP